MKTTVAFVVLLLVAGAVAEPCCMVPADYKGTISQSAQEAVMFHADGREELILKINYQITGDKMPDRFAWIVTVPNEPDAYAVGDAKLFEEVFSWAESQVNPPDLKGRGPAKGDLGEGLEFGKAVKVGPYEIQPVRALGREALAGLNEWLKKNGFPTEDENHMAYFVDKKFTFLCMKIVPEQGQKAVEKASGVPPLHLSFKSDKPYYPLRFSSRQGVFDVNLYVFTKTDFDFESSNDSLKRINVAKPHGASNVTVATDAFPKSLKDRYAASAFKDYAGAWRLNVLRAKQVNKDNTIATWKEDIFFATKG